jgi:hypothetical protein
MLCVFGAVYPEIEGDLEPPPLLAGLATCDNSKPRLSRRGSILTSDMTRAAYSKASYTDWIGSHAEYDRLTG